MDLKLDQTLNFNLIAPGTLGRNQETQSFFINIKRIVLAPVTTSTSLAKAGGILFKPPKGTKF